jgi:hypothetical protein
VALLIARRLETPSTDTGSSVAALSKELQTTMVAALEGTHAKRTPPDDIRDRMQGQRVGARARLTH